jgi:hypothetical protein
MPPMLCWPPGSLCLRGRRVMPLWSPETDPLRTPVDRGCGSIPQSGRRPSRPCHARDPPLLPRCIAMHRRSPAKLPDVCRDPVVLGIVTGRVIPPPMTGAVFTLQRRSEMP